MSTTESRQPERRDRHAGAVEPGRCGLDPAGDGDGDESTETESGGETETESGGETEGGDTETETGGGVPALPEVSDGCACSQQDRAPGAALFLQVGRAT